jgi:hypothetical protein
MDTNKKDRIDDQTQLLINLSSELGLNPERYINNGKIDVNMLIELLSGLGLVDRQEIGL